jgi:hypothetical protein
MEVINLPYQVFSKSIHGAGHIDKGMPCEDYGKVYEDEECKIFTVADGHGDSNCPRSSVGSKLICEIAINELKDFHSAIKQQEWISDLFDEKKQEIIIRQLITSMFGKWSCAVCDDFNNNPLTDEEYMHAEEYATFYKKGDRIEHIYGTTLIAGIITSNYLLLLQQGDGRCDLFDQQGNVSQPIPWDDRCFANVTTSVCDSDAISSCRYFILDVNKNPIVACIAGSDGVEDSYSSMDKMHTYYRNLLKYACEKGINQLERYLEFDLSELSANGSRDDITISGIIDIEAVKPFLDKMTAENAVVEVQDEILRINDKLKSMSRKMEYLQSEYDAFYEKYKEVYEEYQNLSIEYDKISKDIEIFETADSEIQPLDNFINNCKDTNVLSATTTFFDTLKEHTLSAYSLSCLRTRKQTLEKEKAEMESKLKDVESKKIELEKEYIPYKERYDYFVEEKDKAETKKSELLNMFADVN